jgi:predicted enzyme related to lactoylglutathione lyase
MAHRSRLATIVIDCRTESLDDAAHFWAEALARPALRLSDPASAAYRQLEGTDDEVGVLVQAVTHPSRVHLDIETDDIESEVRRLEALGAYRVAQVRDGWVMQAPTGQRFCVVPPQRADFARRAHLWDIGD